MNPSLLRQWEAALIGTGTLIFIEPMLSDTVPGANNGNDLFLPEK